MDVSLGLITPAARVHVSRLVGERAHGGHVGGLRKHVAHREGFFGTISDWLGKRKGLAVLGYGLGRCPSRSLLSRLPCTGRSSRASWTDRQRDTHARGPATPSLRTDAAEIRGPHTACGSPWTAWARSPPAAGHRASCCSGPGISGWCSCSRSFGRSGLLIVFGVPQNRGTLTETCRPARP